MMKYAAVVLAGVACATAACGRSDDDKPSPSPMITAASTSVRIEKVWALDKVSDDGRDVTIAYIKSSACGEFDHADVTAVAGELQVELYVRDHKSCASNAQWTSAVIHLAEPLGDRRLVAPCDPMAVANKPDPTRTVDERICADIGKLQP